ncbi:glutathione S-transferase [Vibrio sp. 10N.286.49.B3]|uniref:glutathione S-transferase family protein n=1 Tax=Vibrio sp. 10N.286.49.B3 TaxID=1880855 RepID=UPI000C825121|nr:glutathione S-transferase [Vibrio sp. 10N.286.49.B3]PMH43779.1 glutathione S-transferase [Vibrio sp. 10N.286.49.B3]
MKLYEAEMTPSCRRVAIFMNELGIDIDRVPVNVRDGENLTEEFLSKSINGKVPMLELADGTLLCESVAICRYLNGVYDNNLYLFGRDALEQAKVEMWSRVVELQGLYVAFQAFRNITGIYKDREHCIEEWGIESKSRVRMVLPKIEKTLANNTFIIGDRLTIVDITAYIYIGFIINALKIDVFTLFPNIQRWFDELSQREAFV